MTNEVLALDDLTALSTEFSEVSDLHDWLEHVPTGFTPKWRPPHVESGRLILQPFASGWFEDNQAGHLYRRITGDFIVTAKLIVRGVNTTLPTTEFSLAGVLVRSPRSFTADQWRPGEENWLFFSSGSASPAGQPHYEIKSTTNSLSTLKIVPAAAGSVELRIARHGELFTLLHRPGGAVEWKVVDQMIRPDLPDTLDVGLTAYADWGSVADTYPDYRRYNENGVGEGEADLVAEIDWIRFRRPRTGRFPIANLDAPATFGADVIAERRKDLLSD